MVVIVVILIRGIRSWGAIAEFFIFHDVSFRFPSLCSQAIVLSLNIRPILARVEKCLLQSFLSYHFKKSINSPLSRFYLFSSKFWSLEN